MGTRLFPAMSAAWGWEGTGHTLTSRETRQNWPSRLLGTPTPGDVKEHEVKRGILAKKVWEPCFRCGSCFLGPLRACAL